MRCRSSSAWGPRTARGVREPCMVATGCPSRTARRPRRAVIDITSERVFAALLIADPNGFLNPRQKDFTFPDLTCLGGLENGVYNRVHELVGKDHFEFDLGQEIDSVLA